MNPSLLVLAAIGLGRVHWAGILVAFLLWWGISAWKERDLVLFPGIFGLISALVILVFSTAFSVRPSGLAWLGLLQWVALLSGVFLVQAWLRRGPGRIHIALWSLLAVGTIDLLAWSREIFLQYARWWDVRIDGLPLFPFRLRLFGSHGSTQAAVWLVVLLLLGALWAWPTIGRRLRRIALPWLLWCAILLGFCDSRLAMGGGIVALVYAGIRRVEWRFAWSLLLLSNVIWLLRDHLHPSRILEGGGVDQGMMQVVLVGAVPVLVLLGKRFPRIMAGRLWILAGVVPGAAALAMPFLQRGAASWSTGRLEFWRVGWEAVLESPWLGSGPWSFPWLHAATIDWSRGFLAMHPHNWVLECLTTGGVLFLVCIASCFSGRLGPPSEGRSPSILAALGLGIGVSMAFDSPMASPQVLLVCVLLGGWALSRQESIGEVRMRRVWAILPLVVVVPFAHLAEALAGKTLLDSATSLREPREWAIRLLEGAPLPSEDPQWMREVLMARTILHDRNPDSLNRIVPMWDSLIRLEPTYLPNRLHREFALDRLGRGNRLEGELLAFERGGWERGFVREISPRWHSSYPTDSAEYWLGKAMEWRAQGDESRLRWVALWLRVAARSSTCAEIQRESVLGLSPRPLSAPSVAMEQLYGSAGSRTLFVPELERRIRDQCLRYLRN